MYLLSKINPFLCTFVVQTPPMSGMEDRHLVDVRNMEIKTFLC